MRSIVRMPPAPRSTCFVPLLLATLAAVPACSKPKPPRVNAQSTELVASNGHELVVRVHLVANNPNEYAMVVHGVDAHVTVDGKPVTEVRVPQAIDLAPGRDVPFATDVAVPKQVVAELRAEAPKVATVPYHVDGNVDVGTSSVHVKVPFEKDGSITRETLVAKLRSLPP